MLINDSIAGLLSFGPGGLDLPLGDLNVLIGPERLGQIESTRHTDAFACRAHEPGNSDQANGRYSRVVVEGRSGLEEATLEAFIDAPDDPQPLQHRITIAEHGGRVEVVDEWIQREHDLDTF